MRLYRCVSIDGIEDRHTAYESPRVYLDRMQGYVGLTPLYRRTENRVQSNYVRHLSFTSSLRTFLRLFSRNPSFAALVWIVHVVLACLPSLFLPLSLFFPFLSSCFTAHSCIIFLSPDTNSNAHVQSTLCRPSTYPSAASRCVLQRV